jgi:hypothetical protein
VLYKIFMKIKTKYYFLKKLLLWLNMMCIKWMFVEKTVSKFFFERNYSSDWMWCVHRIRLVIMYIETFKLMLMISKSTIKGTLSDVNVFRKLWANFFLKETTVLIECDVYIECLCLLWKLCTNVLFVKNLWFSLNLQYIFPLILLGDILVCCTYWSIFSVF